MNEIHDKIALNVVRKIAEGGMGTVYEAIQQGANGFEKRVAVKTLRSELSRNLRFVEMFIGEAKLVANLVHENIVQILHLGRNLNGYYIVMEYVNGLSLYDFLRFHHASGKGMPEKLAVFIASRIARGLSYAHSRQDHTGTPLNIVHRDVCPNNVLITTEGLPKLTDFGIAKARHTAISENDRSLMGKLSYMSPEQARREAVDARADQYSLGAVMFELLSGARIRQLDSQDKLMDLAAAGDVDFTPLDKLKLSGEIQDLIHRALAPDPAHRFPDAAEMAQKLELFIYKDGYGPTIQTLEAYLKEQFPYLYRRKPHDTVADVMRTVVMQSRTPRPKPKTVMLIENQPTTLNLNPDN